MSLNLIVWKLKQVMDENGITTKALAVETSVSENSVSNWRRTEMPRLNGERLNQILISVNKLRTTDGPMIGLHDILGQAFTPEELAEAGYKGVRIDADS